MRVGQDEGDDGGSNVRWAEIQRTRDEETVRFVAQRTLRSLKLKKKSRSQEKSTSPDL